MLVFYVDDDCVRTIVEWLAEFKELLRKKGNKELKPASRRRGKSGYFMAHSSRYDGNRIVINIFDLDGISG